MRQIPGALVCLPAVLNRAYMKMLVLKRKRPQKTNHNTTFSLTPSPSKLSLAKMSFLAAGLISEDYPCCLAHWGVCICSCVGGCTSVHWCMHVCMCACGSQRTTLGVGCCFSGGSVNFLGFVCFGDRIFSLRLPWLLVSWNHYSSILLRHCLPNTLFMTAINISSFVSHNHKCCFKEVIS